MQDGRRVDRRLQPTRTAASTELDFERARRHCRPLSVAICDIDRFKAINDRLGHAGGDAVPRHFVEALKAHVRTSDLVGRWGGEEFLIVLPDADRDAAAAVLERLRARPLGTPLDTRGQVTFSAGIASTAEVRGLRTVDALIARADARLYVAKVSHDAIIFADSRSRSAKRHERSNQRARSPGQLNAGIKSLRNAPGM